mgnify:CR=1 FL=1
MKEKLFDYRNLVMGNECFCTDYNMETQWMGMSYFG